MSRTAPLHALRPTAPFDFAQSLRFLGEFVPTSGEQTVGNQVLTKAVRLPGKTVGFTVQSTGTVSEPQLTYALTTEQPLTASETEAVLSRVRVFLSLDEDIQPFYALAEQDPPFWAVVQALFGYHQVKFLTPFECACWAILTQRTPMVQAHQVKRTLTQQFGGTVLTPTGLAQAFPGPEDLADASEAELTALTRNTRKGAALVAVTRAFLGVDEAWLRAGPREEVRAWLLDLHGIGTWSASFILLRGLGRMDEPLFTDPDSLLTQELSWAAARIYGPLSFTALSQHAARYGSWQGYWGHYLRAVTVSA